ncbi:MAG: LpxI family protein [Phycisphaerales bacterium]
MSSGSGGISDPYRRNWDAAPRPEQETNRLSVCFSHGRNRCNLRPIADMLRRKTSTVDPHTVRTRFGFPDLPQFYPIRSGHLPTMTQATAVTILPDPPPPPTPIGLIAGAGRLPLIIAQGLRESGHPVHGLGLRDQFDPTLPGMCDSFQQAGVLRVGSWGRLLRERGVSHAIMVGRVDKARLMFDPLRVLKNLPDLRTIKAWYGQLRHDRRSHAILRVVAQELEREGVSLLDSTAPIAGEMAHAGVMTAREPSARENADISFAWPLMRELLRLDIGQSIAVRELDVIAVEGIEGSDRMIERAGQLCRRGGWVMCKGARAGHDRRSDVPTVGVKTIENLHAAGGSCLALAAGDVIMIDKVEMLNTADRLGISIVGVPSAIA